MLRTSAIVAFLILVSWNSLWVICVCIDPTLSFVSAWSDKSDDVSECAAVCTTPPEPPACLVWADDGKVSGTILAVCLAIMPSGDRLAPPSLAAQSVLEPSSRDQHPDPSDLTPPPEA